MAEKQTVHSDANDQSVELDATASTDEVLDEAAAEEWQNEEAPSYEDLEAALAESHRISDEINERLLRSQAEMENLRRRTERELENAHKYALEKISAELLIVRDSLELGLVAAKKPDVEVGSVVEGVELTLKQLIGAMEKHGIKQINPLNEKFNPELHQAMSVQETADVEPNHVVTVFQSGYTLNDRLLRPALVVVSKAASGEPQGGPIDETA